MNNNMDNDLALSGCVLITGAAGGLGWEMARVFHRRGHALVLADINAEQLDARAAELATPERVAVLAGDITDHDHQQALVDLAQARFSGVAVLVNNAGITHRSLAEKTDPAVLRKVMHVDWQAPLELALRAMPQIRQHRGGLINIGSMAGWMPVLGRTAYCAAKAALSQSFEVIRCEQQRHGVHVLMAYPSFIDTPIEQHALGHDGKPARHARSMVGKMKSADWMAERIVVAWGKRQKRVYSDNLAVFGALLWRVAPDLYQRIMMKKFAVELEQ